MPSNVLKANLGIEEGEKFWKYRTCEMLDYEIRRADQDKIFVLVSYF